MAHAIRPPQATCRRRLANRAMWSTRLPALPLAPRRRRQISVSTHWALLPWPRPSALPVPPAASPSRRKRAMFIRHNQRGVSLVELVMFIVIVSVAVAGILQVMNITNRGSADPLIHKQALAIAESLLEEVELMPFTI